MIQLFQTKHGHKETIFLLSSRNSENKVTFLFFTFYDNILVNIGQALRFTQSTNSEEEVSENMCRFFKLCKILLNSRIVS